MIVFKIDRLKISNFWIIAGYKLECRRPNPDIAVFVKIMRRGSAANRQNPGGKAKRQNKNTGRQQQRKTGAQSVA